MKNQSTSLSFWLVSLEECQQQSLPWGVSPTQMHLCLHVTSTSLLHLWWEVEMEDTNTQQYVLSAKADKLFEISHIIQGYRRTKFGTMVSQHFVRFKIRLEGESCLWGVRLRSFPSSKNLSTCFYTIPLKHHLPKWKRLNEWWADEHNTNKSTFLSMTFPAVFENI